MNQNRSGSRPPADPRAQSGWQTPAPRTLLEVRAGETVRIRRFSSAPPAWQERLLAHGIAPGCVVRVMQHQPITVIQVDHTELGFEHDVARVIEVEPL
ncbi:MAG: FeoA family protein [Anaerolineae bacterium]|nr:ferrous iron transport protein A [Thermoflexales bacterium]MDW8407813.1 FeoA family protein [Anaerolineae bacterium]